MSARIFSPYYAAPVWRRTLATTVDLREQPSTDARLGSQLLAGERFAVLAAEKGWCWGYCEHDHYVGYVARDALGEAPAPSHVVAVREATMRAAPRDDAAVTGTLPMGAQLAALPDDGWIEAPGGWLSAAEAKPLELAMPDPVAVAERLLGAPYLWGGRSGAGIDCSGLVQLALAFCGIAAPRDSDMQQAALGGELGDDAPLARGDLIFFPGHVGMMIDGETLLHATHHHGRTMTEPLADVIARIGAEHDRPVRARKRI